MFTNLYFKTRELFFNGKITLYLGLAALTVMIVYAVLMATTAPAFGPIPGTVGG